MFLKNLRNLFFNEAGHEILRHVFNQQAFHYRKHLSRTTFWIPKLAISL